MQAKGPNEQQPGSHHLRNKATHGVYPDQTVSQGVRDPPAAAHCACGEQPGRKQWNPQWDIANPGDTCGN